MTVLTRHVSLIPSQLHGDTTGLHGSYLTEVQCAREILYCLAR